MKINSEDLHQSASFDKHEGLCKTESYEALNHVTKRMMDQSMLAYSQKMQDLSSIRKGSIGLARTDRFNLGRTPSWLEQAPSLSGSSHTQNNVGRRWATLHKLRKPNDTSLKSISDSVWHYKDTKVNPQSFNGHLCGANTNSMKENRPRSRSVADLMVRNYTDNQPLESPHARPRSEQGTIEINPVGTNPYAHPVTFKGSGFLSASNTYMWDNAALRGETNVLTLPDITDTAGEISNMEISSSVQIVPFPAITELQAVPAKLHSSPLIPPTTKKLPIDTKVRHSGQKTLFYKDINKDTATLSKISQRIANTNTDKNAKYSSSSQKSSKTDKERNKVQKTTSHIIPVKSGKDMPKKDMSKDSVTKVKIRKSTHTETKDNVNTLVLGSNSAVNNGITKSSSIINDRKDNNGKAIETVQDNSETEESSEPSRSSPTAQDDASNLTPTNEQTNDELTRSVSASAIKSVLKKQRPKNEKGEKKPKSPKKTVQFGPKMVKEVTKIVYPWNVTHSSSEDDDTTNDENSDDDEDEDDDDSCSDD